MVMKMETCFLCLENTSNKVCIQCETYGCNRCWEEYIKFNQKNKPNMEAFYEPTILCPVCKIKCYGSNLRATRSRTRDVRRGTFIREVKNYLWGIDMTFGKEAKMKVVEDMFKYLINHQWFLKEEPRFAQTVKNKLVEFWQTENWNKVLYWHFRLFNSSLPVNTS